MIPIKGLVVCVDYDDYLRHTLRRNARHMTEILVVTSQSDTRTHEVVRSIPSARCYKTDAFTRGQKRFNKGAAIEEAFEVLGRDGWILVWDADIVLPSSLNLPPLAPSMLYGARRRISKDSTLWPEQEWRERCPLSREAGLPGFFQLFHGSALYDVRPWYGTESNHAGIGDAKFQNHWPSERKQVLPLEVLHLGPRDTNWFGRASPRLDGEKTPLTQEQAIGYFRAEWWRK